MIYKRQMASASSGSDNFPGQPGMSNWEQKIVEFRLYRNPTISNKSLASVSFCCRMDTWGLVSFQNGVS